MTAQVFGLIEDIQLAERSFLSVVRQVAEVWSVSSLQLTNGRKPFGDVGVLGCRSRTDAAAAVMTRHNHMTNLQRVDCICERRFKAGIAVNSEVGDITVDEDGAGVDVDNFSGRHAAV